MHNLEPFKVTGIGEILWDLLPQGKQLGGAPANFAYHSKALGSKSSVVSAVGNDILGKEILEKLSDSYVDSACIQIDDHHPTGTVQVQIDSEGTPHYRIHEETAWDNIHFTEPLKILASEADAVCFGSLAQRSRRSRDTIDQFLRATPQNCIRIFDINLRQRFFTPEVIENSLNLATYFKLNDEEMAVVADIFSFTGSEEKIIDRFFKEFKLDLVALTKHAKGSHLYTAQNHSFMKASANKIQDTVGAGDAFTAALAFFSLERQSLKEIHHNAATLASFVCTQKGATPILTNEIRSQLK